MGTHIHCPNGPQCGYDYRMQHFDCPGCKRRVCYCGGCSLDDGLDDYCDECWSRLDEARSSLIDAIVQAFSG